MDRARRMGEGSITSLLLKFSAPAVVGMLAQALYNVVDRIFVGQAVGPQGITGTTVAFPFVLVLIAFSMLIGFGAAALISIRLGEQKLNEAELVLGNAIVLLAGISLTLTVTALPLLDPLLVLFGASSDSLPFARDYLWILIAGSLFQSIGFGVNAMIRGEGNPRIAMYTLLIGSLLNIILDPIFLFGFGWGMQGAAAATVISQAVSAIWVIAYFLGGRSLLKLHVRNLKLRSSVCVTMIAIGSPMFAMQIAASVMNCVLNNQLRHYGGDISISVIGIIHSIAMFIAMPIFGLAQGAQPIVGFNHGSHQFDRVKKTLQTAMFLATALCVAGFVIVMLFPSEVIKVFNRHDPELLALGTHAIRVCLLMLPVIGFQIIGASYFQAVGKPKQALFLGLSRQVLLLIPAILIFPYYFGLNGVWAAIPAADLISALLTGTWLYFEMRHLEGCRQQQNHEDSA